MRVKLPRLAILDRDGVLNVDALPPGRIYRIEDFKWMPGAKLSIRLLNQYGYMVVVATNQAGIGRGLYTRKEFIDLTHAMLEDAGGDGAVISAVYFCPHTPEDGCECRKPGTDLLKQAVRDWGGYEHTFMIGDKESDMQAAKRFGIPGYLFEGGNLLDLVGAIVEEDI